MHLMSAMLMTSAIFAELFLLNLTDEIILCNPFKPKFCKNVEKSLNNIVFINLKIIFMPWKIACS